MEATRDRDVPTGLAVAEAVDRAHVSSDRILTEAYRLDFDAELLDMLHATSALIARAHPVPSGARYLQAARLFRSVRELPWEHDDVGERHEILARFSYLAWNECRRLGRIRGMALWEQVCLGEVRTQEHLANFLELEADRWPADLSSRFLQDPIVMMAVTSLLNAKRNDDPSRVAVEVAAAYSSFGAIAQSVGAEEIQYFLAELALVAATSSRHLGNFGEADRWMVLARDHAASTASSRPLLARVEFCELCLQFDRRRHGAVLAQAPTLIAKLSELGMVQEAAKARFAEASAAKDAGDSRTAFVVLDRLLQSRSLTDDVLLRGLAFLTRAEVRGSLGDLQGARKDLERAYVDIQASKTGWAMASLYAVLAELHRDRGDFEVATRLYRAALAVYDALRMEHKGAYIRIVLAETLLLANRDVEAMTELARAIRYIEGRDLGEEARASVALLSEALQRQQTDPEALRRLREQLQQMRKDGDL